MGRNSQNIQKCSPRLDRLLSLITDKIPSLHRMLCSLRTKRLDRVYLSYLLLALNKNEMQKKKDLRSRLKLANLSANFSISTYGPLKDHGGGKSCKSCATAGGGGNDPPDTGCVYPTADGSFGLNGSI